MNKEEILRLEAYLKEKMHPGLRVLARKETDDSVEVYLGADLHYVVRTEGGAVLQATARDDDAQGLRR